MSDAKLTAEESEDEEAEMSKKETKHEEAEMSKKETKRVVIWTKSRPWLVACGELVSRKGDEVTLREARLAVYFDATSRGVLGLGLTGPGPGSRISPPCEEVTIGGVEGVVTATPSAVQAWEAEPWK